jgi:hypothetical protein
VNFFLSGAISYFAFRDGEFDQVNAGSQPRIADVDVEGCRQPYKVLLETEVDDLLCTMFCRQKNLDS